VFEEQEQQKSGDHVTVDAKDEPIDELAHGVRATSERESMLRTTTEEEIAQTAVQTMHVPLVAAEAVVPVFSYPVMMGDGRQLKLEWQLGDDSQEVALRFATCYDIPLEELPAIARFVRAVSSTAA